MSQHNRVYHITKLSVIVLLILGAFYMGTKAKDFVEKVQGQKARLAAVADSN